MSKGKNKTSLFGLVILLILVSFFAFFHLFTKKGDLRDEGITLYNSSKYEEAIDKFDEALDCKQWFAKNIDVDVLLYKADSYIKLSDYHKAYDIYELILKDYSKKYYNKGNVQFLSNLAVNLELYSNGNYDSQAEFFASVVERGYDEFSLYAADCFGRKGDFEGMLKYYDIYTSKYGFTTYIAYQYASYYMNEGDYKKALSYIESYMDIDEEYSEKLKYNQIVCYFKLADFEKALKCADKYLKNNKSDEQAKELRDFLDTRVNVNTHVVHDIYNLNNDDSTYIIGE